MRGVKCPQCGRFAVAEPAGIRCITHAHWTFFRSALPRNHCSGWGGWNWKSRERQRAVDAMYDRPARARDIMWDLLERLEGKPKDAPPEAPTAPHHASVA